MQLIILSVLTDYIEEYLCKIIRLQILMYRVCNVRFYYAS